MERLCQEDKDGGFFQKFIENLSWANRDMNNIKIKNLFFYIFRNIQKTIFVLIYEILFVIT